MHDVEAGFEICSGGEGLMLESFNVSVQGKATISTTAPTTPTAVDSPDILIYLGISGLMAIVIILIALKLKKR
nr:MAG: hypothetical protein AM325_07310 [Candidatus Thorarchaeota archaeon SMTZ1-45]